MDQAQRCHVSWWIGHCLDQLKHRSNAWASSNHADFLECFLLHLVCFRIANHKLARAEVVEISGDGRDFKQTSFLHRVDVLSELTAFGVLHVSGVDTNQEVDDSLISHFAHRVIVSRQILSVYFLLELEVLACVVAETAMSSRKSKSVDIRVSDAHLHLIH